MRMRPASFYFYRRATHTLAPSPCSSLSCPSQITHQATPPHPTKANQGRSAPRTERGKRNRCLHGGRARSGPARRPARGVWAQALRRLRARGRAALPRLLAQPLHQRRGSLLRLLHRGVPHHPLGHRHRHRLRRLPLPRLLRRRLRRRRRRRCCGRRRRAPPPPRPPRAPVPGGRHPLRALPLLPRRLQQRGGRAPQGERRAPRRQRGPRAPHQAGRRQAGRRVQRSPPRRRARRATDDPVTAAARAARAAQEHLRPFAWLPQDEPQRQASRVQADEPGLAARVRGRGRQGEGRGGGGGAPGWGGEEAHRRAGVRGVQPGHAQDGALQQVGGDRCVPVRRPVPVRARRRRAPPCHSPSMLQDRGLPHGALWRRLPLRPPLPLPTLHHPRRPPFPPAPLIMSVHHRMPLASALSFIMLYLQSSKPPNVSVTGEA